MVVSEISQLPVRFYDNLSWNLPSFCNCSWRFVKAIAVASPSSENLCSSSCTFYGTFLREIVLYKQLHAFQWKQHIAVIVIVQSMWLHLKNCLRYCYASVKSIFTMFYYISFWPYVSTLVRNNNKSISSILFGVT